MEASRYKNLYNLLYELGETHFWLLGRKNIVKKIIDKYITLIPRRKSPGFPSTSLGKVSPLTRFACSGRMVSLSNQSLSNQSPGMNGDLVKEGGSLKAFQAEGALQQKLILDAGCGTGGMTNLLKDYGMVYHMDSSETALGFCQKQKLKLICQGTVMDLPFKDAQFDLVTSFDVLSHVSVTNERKALGELCRVVKPDGFFLFMDVANNFIRSTHDDVYETRERYNKKNVIKMLEDAGFVILKISYANFFLFHIISSIRLFRKIFDRYATDSQSDLRPMHPFINQVLINILKIEAILLKKIDLPAGSSIICLARKCEKRIQL